MHKRRILPLMVLNRLERYWAIIVDEKPSDLLGRWEPTAHPRHRRARLVSAGYFFRSVGFSWGWRTRGEKPRQSLWRVTGIVRGVYPPERGFLSSSAKNAGSTACGMRRKPKSIFEHGNQPGGS